MKRISGTWKRIVLLVMAALWMVCMTAAADEASGDNSLYSLGLENGECSPEFYYSTLEYNVTVPAGTTELLLDPITSDSNASIIDISGTQLDDNGNGTVYITVEAPNGARVSYVLNVTSDGETAAASAETETEDAQALQEEEERKQAESEEAARLAAQQKENEEKVNTLTTENEQLTQRLDVLLKVLYGLVAFAVILLFFIINQSLRNKDLKDELKEARSEADMNNEFTRKERNMPSDFYYTPAQQGRNQNMMEPAGVQRADATSSTQAVFGNASQRLQAQPMPGQVYAPPVQDAQAMIKKEQKKAVKATKKAETKGQQPEQAAGQQSVQMAGQQPVQAAGQQQPVQAAGQQSAKKPGQKPVKRAAKQPVKKPVQKAEKAKPQQMPDVPVQATMEEPDVKVDMIDL